MKTATLVKITNSKNADTLAAAADVNSDWAKSWDEDNYNGFKAMKVTADCCKKAFEAVMPEDYEGAALTCGHCSASICLG